MIDPRSVSSVGHALEAALLRFSAETCLIESDRDRDLERLTYGAFRTRALPLAARLHELGIAPGDRVAILMTNQPAWHLAAFAALRQGGVLVPLDFLQSAEEQLARIAHSRPRALVVEHHLWRALGRSEGFAALAAELVLVAGAPEGESLPRAPGGAAHRLENFRSDAEPPGPVPRGRDDPCCIVYSSGTAGRPKGCVLTHENYLRQLESLTALHPFRPGVRYLSILPTNHAIDFTVGFLGPYLCGATVVHLRTLRPEFVRAAFSRYRITHTALVPAVLASLEESLRARFAAMSAPRRALLALGRALHGLLGAGRPSPRIARVVLAPVHTAFGGRLEALFVGGARSDPETLRFFHGLGIPVANGYGLTEACTAVTLDRLDPPRPETVGVPLPGVEVEVRNPDAAGIGEVWVRSATVMSAYLDDEELTRETIVDGWLRTGDLGSLDAEGRLRLLGRRKNMIVTPGGKNVYPEDVEGAFHGIAPELCVIPAHALWPGSSGDERLLLVARSGNGEAAELARRVAAVNRGLRDFQRVRGLILWDRDFPRTASRKVRRDVLAGEVAASADPVRDVLEIP